MKVYAKREDTGKRILVAIQCDGCDAEIKPNVEIASSGWMKSGILFSGQPLKSDSSDWCPDCAFAHNL